jgi:DNA polymerase-3 subunit epsilon
MKVVCFDTETSGLVENRTRALKRQPEIIEIYGCVADLAGDTIEHEVERMIRPEVPLTEDNMSRHHITNEMLQDKPPFKDVAGEIMSLFIRAPVAIAHNATFDWDMVELEFERMGVKVRRPRLICTVEQTMFVRGHRLTLSDLHEYLFGIAHVNAHRARADTLALLRCCRELYKREML